MFFNWIKYFKKKKEHVVKVVGDGPIYMKHNFEDESICIRLTISEAEEVAKELKIWVDYFKVLSEKNRKEFKVIDFESHRKEKTPQ